MAAERLGSALRIDSSANSGSQSVSVPAGTNYVLMMASGWPDAGTTFFTGAAFTLDGASFGLIDGEHADGSHNNTTAWGLANPSNNGNFTFAWDWGGASSPNEGMSMFLVFVGGVDTTDPVRSANGGTSSGASANTGSLTAETGDYLSAVSSGAGAASWTNASELLDGTFNGQSSSLAEASPTGNITVTVNASEFVAITGVVLRGLSFEAEQEGFRWRNDDGDEDDATWIDAQDTDIDAAPLQTLRLRIISDFTGDPPSQALKLQYRRDDEGDTEWIDV